MVVLEKPAGLLAVPGRGEDKQDCLSARAQAIWPDALIVHRLDMATSGLMVMARGIEAQRQLSRAFEKRQVHKRYQALVVGQIEGPADEAGWSTIDWPLAVDWLNRPRSVVCWQTGKPSLTRWRRLECAAMAGKDPLVPTEWISRVEMEPMTGRTHQLRVHMQALGHPIVGDPLYANPATASATLPFPPRLCLHATELVLPHPVHGEPMAFSSPCPF
ncbi:MAG TPA: RluA family pseudouridine synthase [Hydrogenophaga sp.]|uniref:RluA family pseudouridine synthase n=1 Tax=Hydrogenophaga sp. TaxID=1904254 RepID=UPI002C6D6B42|nr:RluA family pseudouridine synthase [Hydrogenophaga sp.]HMN93792.1 RluA family pseudouridine synthase [Hydrogenophaga sp.]HMP09685.1 RluA family pseudouridine synthase [Hydrogenophaga sp.]